MCIWAPLTNLAKKTNAWGCLDISFCVSQQRNGSNFTLQEGRLAGNNYLIEVLQSKGCYCVTLPRAVEPCLTLHRSSDTLILIEAFPGTSNHGAASSYAVVIKYSTRHWPAMFDLFNLKVFGSTSSKFSQLSFYNAYSIHNYNLCIIVSLRKQETT